MLVGHGRAIDADPKGTNFQMVRMTAQGSLSPVEVPFSPVCSVRVLGSFWLVVHGIVKFDADPTRERFPAGKEDRAGLA